MPKKEMVKKAPKATETTVEAPKKPVSKPSSNPFLALHPTRAGRSGFGAGTSGKKAR
jgi:hypothetical protein